MIWIGNILLKSQLFITLKVKKSYNPTGYKYFKNICLISKESDVTIWLLYAIRFSNPLYYIF
jgi:hypothetical protein